MGSGQGLQACARGERVTFTPTCLHFCLLQGGIVRFYRGYFPALVQGPVSRFGDTASNAGMLALLDSYESTKGLPTGVKTMSASAVAASFRLFLMPIDTVKTIMQVNTCAAPLCMHDAWR